MKRFKTAGKAVVAAMAMFVAMGLAQIAAAEVSTSGSVTGVSQYIWRGFDLGLNEEKALQAGISIAHDSGIALDLWGSYTLDSDVQIDEFDYTLSYATMINKIAEFSIGYTLYTFPSTPETGGQTQTESREAFIGFAFPDAFLSPSITIYHDWEMGDGTYYFLGLGHDFTFTDENIPPLSLSIGLGYNDDQWTTKSGVSDIDLGLSMTFTSGSVEITPSINYVITPENVDAANTDNDVWFGLGFSFGL